jgi:crossover junction endodeoxyribonuclease RusA
MISVTLPWPHRSLSPNARVHWAALSRAKRAYRAIALIHAPLEAAQVEAELRVLTEAKGLSYTQRGPE